MVRLLKLLENEWKPMQSHHNDRKSNVCMGENMKKKDTPNRVSHCCRPLKKKRTNWSFYPHNRFSNIQKMLFVG